MRYDFHLLKWQTLFFVLSLSLSAGCLSLSYGRLLQHQIEFEQTQQRFIQLQQRVTEKQVALQTWGVDFPLYQSLQQRQIIGVEKRLDWIESVEAFQGGRPGIEIAYSLEAQKPFDLLLAPNADKVLYASPMNIQLKLLHELDLLAFLEHLPTQTIGLPLLRTCNIERLKSNENSMLPNPDTAQLAANCKFDWLTFKEK